MSIQDLAALFGRDDSDDDRPARDPAIEAEVLRDLAKEYLAPATDFRVGDVVTWKGGLKNARYPEQGHPMVVVALRPGRLVTDEPEQNGHAGGLDDVVCLLRSRDGIAMTHSFDARRLRLMTEDELRIVRAAA